MKFRDKIWLWGQSPDCHWEKDNIFKLPAHSRMTPMEGAVYFDIPNMCRVRMKGLPKPPFDQESIALDTCREVVWSVLGADGEQVSEWGDLEEVIRQAKMYPNVTGGVFDDFFSPERLSVFTPDKLAEVKRRLVDGVGRDMDTWVVSYEIKFDEDIDLDTYLNCFDVVTFWVWFGYNLDKLDSYLDRIISMCPTKRIMAGLYMWDYGSAKPMTIEQMNYQTDIMYRYLKEGKIDGIIVCSNCIADLGLETVEWTREWLRSHRDDEI